MLEALAVILVALWILVWSLPTPSAVSFMSFWSLPSW